MFCDTQDIRIDRDRYRKKRKGKKDRMDIDGIPTTRDGKFVTHY
jgi:hypothetical protein